MSDRLSGRTIVFLVANEGVEQIELTRPWSAVVEAGGRAVLAAPQAGQVQAFNHLDKAEQFDVEVTTEDLRVTEIDGVVLPGGVANPDQLRTDPRAVEFVRDAVNAGTPVAVICHGPWTLVEADVVRGRRLTSWPSLQTDIRNAGGDWVDEPVVVCSSGPNTFVSSRKPDDLDGFCTAALDAFAAVPARAG